MAEPAVRFPLGEGDLITVQWSGELRTMAVDLDPESGPWLRDLTEDEERQIAEEESKWLVERRAEVGQ